MSPRKRPSKHARASSARPLLGGHQTVEAKADGEWVVRRLSGAGSVKAYRCPGCRQLIAPATPHFVVWPVEASLLSALSGGQAVDERRHWHTGCWQRRH